MVPAFFFVTLLFVLAQALADMTIADMDYIPPSHGPWIVLHSIEDSGDEKGLEDFTREAKFQFRRNLKRRKLASVYSKKGHQEKRRKIHMTVVEGMTKRELLDLPSVSGVYPDIPMKSSTHKAWGLDRIDQPYLPLGGQVYNPFFKGDGVDVYILDSGIDTRHIEFTPLDDSTRVVQNLFDAFKGENAFGANIDGA